MLRSYNFRIYIQERTYFLFFSIEMDPKQAIRKPPEIICIRIRIRIRTLIRIHTEIFSTLLCFPCMNESEEKAKWSPGGYLKPNKEKGCCNNITLFLFYVSVSN